jgi:hypothetical protein
MAWSKRRIAKWAIGITALGVGIRWSVIAGGMLLTLIAFSTDPCFRELPTSHVSSSTLSLSE